MRKPNRPTDPRHTESVHAAIEALNKPFNEGTDIAAMLQSSVPPDIETVIDEWMPNRITAEQRRLLPVVLLFVRCCVKAAKPTNPRMAREMMRTTTLLSVWAYSEFQNLALEVVFSAHNVEHFSTVVNRHRSKSWRHQTRWVLRCVGRKLNPDGWPLEPPMVGTRLPTMPYSERGGVRVSLRDGDFRSIQPGEPLRSGSRHPRLRVYGRRGGGTHTRRRGGAGWWQVRFERRRS